jgi:nucleotide-binding universal stress UspA family protein
MATIPVSSEAPGTKLVVGVDGSEFAEHVLRVARDLVRVAANAEIHVVTVLRAQSISTDVIHALPAFGPSDEESIAEACEMLRGLCARALEDLPGKVHMHVRLGRPAEQIERLAEEVGADVIVIEAHGRTGVARLFHKSVAAELARNAPCSVLTVRTKHGVIAAPARPLKAAQAAVSTTG